MLDSFHENLTSWSPLQLVQNFGDLTFFFVGPTSQKIFFYCQMLPFAKIHNFPITKHTIIICDFIILRQSFSHKMSLYFKI